MYRKLLLSLLLLWLSVQSLVELHSIVLQPNLYRDAASPKWILIFGIISLYTWIFVTANLIRGWNKELWDKLVDPFQEKVKLLRFRQRLGWGRYVIALLLTCVTIYFFQYTSWGLVFQSFYLRLFVWLNLTYVSAFLLSDFTDGINWRGLFLATIFTSFAFGLASVFSNILSYPFGLYWSDGNRLWDYSLIFGRERYNYPVDQEIYSLTSYGRQVLWGLPFLSSDSTIGVNRFWSAVLYSLPSLILGLIVFSTKNGKKRDTLLLSVWTFLFLNQGPIYTPLTLSAILVALAWERPWWLAMPLIAAGGYYAQVSRFTWIFAPVIWTGMLWLNSKKTKDKYLVIKDWGKAVLFGVAGLLPWIFINLFSQHVDTNAVFQGDAYQGDILSRSLSLLKSQPLLWERLLPNPTYSEGILGALLLAILPLGFLLYSLYRHRVWTPSLGQRVTIMLPLLVLGAVGLVASTKVGGGNNLHNMDMFLVALLFVAAIAWRNSGQELDSVWKNPSASLRMALLFAFALPAYPALRDLKPLLPLSQTEIKRVQIFTGDEIVNTLPKEELVNDALWVINNTVEEYSPLGDVLFIDQRQLLTFGNVPKIPLVPEYEKKVLMNKALASDIEYFAGYYADLEAQRYSLIISEPLKVPNVERNSVSFGEEGSLWTKWVAAPTLCYYEPLFTLKDVYVQALVPREDVSGCEAYLDELGVLQ